ncbi:ABH_G0027290.mRNA.1.CDS.1 [Saccharomyces cerevisiae]|nr:ABH_G0027290.mRNA.1.CDS.1 [Saccharomyces cerevisiae]CAI6594064.1 ABH_G0027290.mRNA.1.CDS.1 [Saccharomyces cerevisiae]
MQYCELDLSGQWLDTFLNPSQFEEKIYCYTLHITKRTLENKRLLLYYEDEFKNMVTILMSLLATVSSCVHAGTLDSNQTEIHEYASSVVDSVNLASKPMVLSM